MSIIHSTTQPTTIEAVVCDACKIEVRDPIAMGEVLHVRLIAGFGSEWGDGNRVEIDLCDACAHRHLSEFARVEPSDERLPGHPGGRLRGIPKGLSSATSDDPLTDEEIQDLHQLTEPKWLHPIEAAWRRAVERVKERGDLAPPRLTAGRGPAGNRLMRHPYTLRFIEGPNDRLRDLLSYAFRSPTPFPRDISPEFADALVWEYIEGLRRKGPVYSGEGLEVWERKCMGRA
jgi:hypothetical protein